MAKSGVYQIKNTRTEAVYIGSSVNIGKRWKRHRTDLRKGTHHSRYLQRAWNKYGAAAFEFSIVFLSHPNETLLYEQCFLDALSPAYNNRRLAASSAGHKMGLEARERIRAARLAWLQANPEAAAKQAAAARAAALRRAPRLEFAGESLPLSAWAARRGVSVDTLKNRLKKYDVAYALTGEAHTQLMHLDGTWHTIESLAAHLQIGKETLRRWKKEGLTPEQMQERANSSGLLLDGVRYTVIGLARKLGINQNTAYAWVREGLTPAEIAARVEEKQAAAAKKDPWLLLGLSRSTAATQLGLSVPTLHRWEHAGLTPQEILDGARPTRRLPQRSTPTQRELAAMQQVTPNTVQRWLAMGLTAEDIAAGKRPRRKNAAIPCPKKAARAQSVRAEIAAFLRVSASTVASWQEQRLSIDEMHARAVELNSRR